ncbi:MAG TPA: hypothetical protein DDZ80_01105 [Cyanobacteria bacterium UBA8803]|nr:hypothetical protein [Cyanobacteria bacterium UBA9273]HBL57204.1 hypothetical protein [Cyanobacteria bacterium UBA8803]
MSNQIKPQDIESTINDSDQKDIELPEPQPESGFIDREERMSIRQSSPTNPRVSDKPEANQEEA